MRVSASCVMAKEDAPQKAEFFDSTPVGRHHVPRQQGLTKSTYR